ncbi:MAG: hybrid sensor histidine kinase/response regulator [Geobacter sp.]|nr:MAG: hybrid sensor histidine kinase/response regulator [Geobacter sp.]
MIERELKILIVEDSENDALLLLRELHKSGYKTHHTRLETRDAMLTALNTEKWDVVLSDYSMPCFSGLEALQTLKESGLDIPFIIVSGNIGEETAVKIMKAGAHDYVFKGNLTRLTPAIEREMAEAEVRHKNRQAEQELRESEARYRSLLESVSDYVYTVLILDGKMVATSHGPGCESVTGYTPDDFNADPELWLRMVPEEDRPEVLKHVDLLLAGATPPTLEHRIIRKDGCIRWIQNCQVPRYDFEGRIFTYNGIVSDITERKLAEEELKFRNLLLTTQQEASLDGILVVDEYNRVLMFNQRFVDMWGLPPEVLETNFDKIAFQTMLGKFTDLGHFLEQLQQHNEHRDGIYRDEVVLTDGSTFDRYSAPMIGPDHRYYGRVWYFRNITEKKNLENQLFQSQKMEAIGQLAGGIAHDFNNILTAIIGFSTIVAMHMDSDNPQRENVNHILAAADRAADLTRSLLAFSRKQIINPQPLDINKTIKNIEKFLQRIIGEDIRLVTVLEHDILTVKADCGQIEQVLMNLAANARDAMPKGGTLTIETGIFLMDSDFIRAHGYGEPGEYALITVTDTGSGMDEETCKKLFEPFFTTKETGKGTGLGLSIAYGIVRQHNGYIDVHSEKGRGTAFHICLPLIRSAVLLQTDNADEITEGGAETILVADDDPSLRELYANILKQFGYDVITAEDGHDAINKFRESRDRVELVLLDIIMPVVNGKEAFDEIRKIRPDVKTIFVSGYTADVIQQRGILDNSMDFLSKPLRPLQLVRKVREILDRAE